jgi:VCBS repeat-containing protein
MIHLSIYPVVNILMITGSPYEATAETTTEGNPMMPISRLFGLIAVLLMLPATANAAETNVVDADKQKAVLVTGASTGIGRKITEVLAEQGHFVYAGARKQTDLDALNEIDNVQSIRLNVTVQEQIDAAVATVAAGGRTDDYRGKGPHLHDWFYLRNPVRPVFWPVQHEQACHRSLYRFARRGDGAA